jgi:hypothetical protein
VITSAIHLDIFCRDEPITQRSPSSFRVEGFGTSALETTKVDSGDHQHARGPILDDLAQRTHVAFLFVGHRNICKSQRTVMTP